MIDFVCDSFPICDIMCVVHVCGACVWCMCVVHVCGACVWCMCVVHAHTFGQHLCCALSSDWLLKPTPSPYSHGWTEVERIDNHGFFPDLGVSGGHFVCSKLLCNTHTGYWIDSQVT